MSNNLNILIADDMHPFLMDGLHAAGIKFTYAPEVDGAQINNLMSTHNALIMRSKFNADKSFIEHCKHLIFIARAGAGMDNIDLEAANEKDVICFNAGEGNRDAVGEHAVGMLLNLAANINKGFSEIKQGIWDREGNRGFEIGHKTIGIVGYGNTGSAVAEKLSGFGCKIIAYDKYKKGYGNERVEEVSYLELLKRSDVITFHVPLTTETSQWIDSAFIHQVEKPFLLLNLSRGGLMNTTSVISGLQSKKILGFGSDVLENENLSTFNTNEKSILNTLFSMNNVVLTPHVGGWTTESYENISKVLLKRVLNFSRDIESFKNHLKLERQIVR